MLSTRLRQRAGAVAPLLAGAAMPLGFAPFGWWWLTPLLLAMLFLAWLDGPPRRRAWRGAVFGFGTFAAGTYWLYISIHDVGGAPPVLAVLVMLALVALMAAYHGLAGWLTARLGTGTAGPDLLLVMPAVFTLCEWLRGWLFGGFPWLSAGYGQIEGPLGAWAPVGGVHGVSLVTALVAGSLAFLLRGARAGGLAGLAVLGLLALATSLLQGRSWTEPSGRPLEVSLVQGGIAQERKWREEELERTKDLFRDLTLPLATADLIIWPEAAIPALAHEVEDYLTALAELVRARRQQLILGILTYDFDRREFRNSLLALGTEEGLYHKRHLVPFGEYFPVPGFVRNFLRLLDLPYQDITPGAARQPPLLAAGVPLAPTICYEDVFGAELRDFLPMAGLLINVSNDGWFGDSIAPHQHLQMARFRALEAGRPMLRSTNTGITALIDARGGVLDRGPQFEAVVVSGTISPYQGITPWVRHGNPPVLAACALLWLAGLAAPRARCILAARFGPNRRQEHRERDSL